MQDKVFFLKKKDNVIKKGKWLELKVHKNTYIHLQPKKCKKITLHKENNKEKKFRERKEEKYNALCCSLLQRTKSLIAKYN